MAEEQVRVLPTPINPIEIKGAIAYSAEHARIWAEGTDEEVEKLGGKHSSKEWASYAQAEAEAYTDEQIAIAKEELSAQSNIASEGAVTRANTYTDTELAKEANLREQSDGALQNAISQEADSRENADNSLQSQIDAIVSSSDVFDVVGTYADLQAYDSSIVPVNDIIKVLVDETHYDAASYYRWTGSVWSYIGSEGASYTKAETDSKFLTKEEAEDTYATQTSVASDISNAFATKASNADGTTIVDNGSTITTVAVREQNESAAIKEWVGTKAQYDAIAIKDPNTTYIVTDEDDSSFLSVDSALSSTSENPVQNKVIFQALQNIDALPSQTGNSGKFLTTNGTTASWATVQQGGYPTLTWYTGNTGTTVTIASTASANLVKIYKNGVLLQPAEDYAISGTTLTLVTALTSTDKITVEVF